jgi:hypothetical protein
MADLKYTITFFSDWNCGSGLTSGPDSDNLVKKDHYDLPFVPGKTIKGLLKEAAHDLYEGTDGFNEFLEICFGEESSGKDLEFYNKIHYSNAKLSEDEINYLKGKPYEISKLYRNIPAIKIDEKLGVTPINSLRSMQVTIPLTLKGRITNIPDIHSEKIKECMKMIKRLGNKRNRGFGRCRFIVEEN